MCCTNANQGTNIKTLPLHPSCSDGDHYLSYISSPVWLKVAAIFSFGIAPSKFTSYVIIKGNEYREVANLSTDAGARTGILNPYCQGGDFYLAFSKFGVLSTDPVFFILFVEKGKYRVVSDLETACKSKWYDKTEYALHENCKGGLYYWAQKSTLSGNVSFCFLKQVGTWGLQFHCTEDLSNDQNGHDYSVHPGVTSFLPGGLAVSIGPTFGEWRNVDSFDNSTDKELKVVRIIKKRVGRVKESVSELEQMWKLSMDYKIETRAGIVDAACQQQFAWNVEYGGRQVCTHRESWNEETEEEDKIKITLAKGQKVYVWQYVLGLGEDPKCEVLYCKNLKLTDSKTSPKDVPLPDSGGIP